MLAHRTQLGILSEDIDTATGELWGNFPQTYSMVGIINAANRLSVNWESVESEVRLAAGTQRRPPR